MRLGGLPSPRSGAVIVGRLLLYADSYVAQWMSQKTNENIIPPYTALGVVGRHGQLTGAVIFNHLHEGNIEISVYAPKVFTRGVIKAAAAFAFDTQGVSRVTARTRASNLHARRVIEKAGFRQEGVLRSYYADGEDSILYGLLKSECRWRP